MRCVEKPSKSLRPVGFVARMRSRSAAWRRHRRRSDSSRGSRSHPAPSCSTTRSTVAAHRSKADTITLEDVDERDDAFEALVRSGAADRVGDAARTRTAEARPHRARARRRAVRGARDPGRTRRLREVPHVRDVGRADRRDRPPSADARPARRDARGHDVVPHDDIRDDPRFEWWPRAHPRDDARSSACPSSRKARSSAPSISPKEDGGTFADDDQQLIELFAAHAAIAIENATLFERSRELTVVEERNRLARDLHDSVAQTLFSLALTAEAAKNGSRRCDRQRQRAREGRARRAALDRLRAASGRSRRGRVSSRRSSSTPTSSGASSARTSTFASRRSERLDPTSSSSSSASHRKRSRTR